MTIPDNRNIAVFCDFENVAIGLRETNSPDFRVRPILERLLLKGSIVVKKAYCDWDRYKDYKRDLHEAAFELIEIPHVRQSGKNSADIRMVVDALDLCYTKTHIDAFVIVSGDSDFSPLISKLKENGKSVIGIGVRGSASTLLVGNCDEFIFYDDLVKKSAGRATPARKTSAPAKTETPPPAAKSTPTAEHKTTTATATAAEKPARTTRRRGRPAAAEVAPATPAEPVAEPGVAQDPVVADKADKADRKAQAIDLVVGTLEQLVADRDGAGSISASLVKSTIKRIHPGFSESEYGYSAFGKILDDAHKKGVLVVERKEGGAVDVSLP